MDRKKCLFLLLFLVSLQISFSIEKNIIVGVQDFKDYMPYSQYKNNKFTGFERELMDMFAQKYGYKFKYVAIPIKRLYFTFFNGDIDLKIPDNEYWFSDIKKGKKIKYSNPIIKYIDGVMVLPENRDIELTEIKEIGTILGYTPITYLEMIKTGKIQLYENPNIEGLMKQLQNGRISGAYINIAVANYYSKNHFQEKNKIVFNNKLPFTKSTRHISSIKHPEIIDEFNIFLDKDKKEIDKLKVKYEVEAGIE